VQQVQALCQPGMFSRGVVSDFLFAKDALFARLTCRRRGYASTRRCQRRCAAVPQPDLVIWLQATPAA
jgi:hypothetical protein